MALTLIKYNLCNVIKRFKFEELEDAVMPIFPEISWSRIKSKLIKNHKTFNVHNVSLIIKETIDNVNLREKEIFNRLTTLEVIDISRHSNRRIWYAYELTESNRAENYLKKRDMEDNIKNEFHSNGLTVDVKTTKHEDITFINIKENKKIAKRKIVRLDTSTFFAFFSGHKYIFCSKKNISFDIMKMIATCIGYDNNKRINLMGKDLKSLIRLLRIKQQGVSHAENINQASAYKPSSPIVKDDGIDYMQDKQRNKYAKQCLGKDPPTLELLVVKASKQPIVHKDLASLLPNETINLGIS
ncbi:uncharacterized protein [Linepithema humile]|uniref:uncharacterized protein isoform X2 n=1 Tax=Linepithema humile TaxID=83485 RepID=UPI00351F15F7